jgi:hypothetical protein
LKPTKRQVLCAFRFLISWQQHNYPSHQSWLEPRTDQSAKTRTRKALIFIFLGPLAVIFFWKDPMVVVHSLLVLANVAIVYGGGQLAGADYANLNSPDTIKRLNIGKITRTVGQSVFLGCNFGLFFVIVATIIGERRAGRRIHPTLWLLLAAWFPLITRGIFGVLQSAVFSVSLRLLL